MTVNYLQGLYSRLFGPLNLGDYQPWRLIERRHPGLDVVCPNCARLFQSSHLPALREGLGDNRRRCGFTRLFVDNERFDVLPTRSSCRAGAAFSLRLLETGPG